MFIFLWYGTVGHHTSDFNHFKDKLDVFTAPPNAEYFNGQSWVSKSVKKYTKYVWYTKGCKT